MKLQIGFRRRRERPQQAEALQTYIIVSLGESGANRLRVDNLPGGGRVIRCFVSPLDALIEATCLTKSGQRFSVIDASSISRDAIQDDRGNRLHACIHHGWIGRGGVIPLRPGSEPAAYGELIKQRPRGRLIRFELDSDALATLDRVHEQAGLFAWRETVRDVARWDPDRLRDTARFALETMPTGVRTDTGPEEQYALFDPEFIQCHIVPRGAVRDDVD
jgi:hypothetical protein